MAEQIQGANAVTEYIYDEFVEQDTLVELFYDEVLVAQFLTVIDDYHVDYASHDLTEDEAEAMTDEEWDPWAEMITLWGEAIETAEFEGGLETEIRFIVDDAGVLIAQVDQRSVYITAGGDWALRLTRLREPVRFKLHEVLEDAHRRILHERGAD